MVLPHPNISIRMSNQISLLKDRTTIPSSHLIKMMRNSRLNCLRSIIVIKPSNPSIKNITKTIRKSIVHCKINIRINNLLKTQNPKLEGNLLQNMRAVHQQVKPNVFLIMNLEWLKVAKVILYINRPVKF